MDQRRKNFTCEYYENLELSMMMGLLYNISTYTMIYLRKLGKPCFPFYAKCKKVNLSQKKGEYRTKNEKVNYVANCPVPF